MQRRLIELVFAGLMVLPLNIHAGPLDTTALTNIAARYKLPMPPADARLVLAHTESWSVLGNSSTSRDPGIYSPAFLLDDKPNNIVVLRGAERQKLEARPNEPLWRPFSTAHVEPKLGGYAVSFYRLSAFVCVVQLAMRGDESTAQDAWKLFSGAQYWSDSEPFDEVAEQIKNPPLLLARCLFDHLRNQVLQQPANWSDIHSQMAALFNEFPALKNERRGEVFNDLTAAINAKSPKPDSVEALLIDWSRRPGNARDYDLLDKDNDADAPARVIILRGSAAVSDLISLLDDQRITAREVPAIMNAPARISRVGELAGRLLEEITGIRSPSGWEPPKASVFRDWLEKRDKIGEAETLAESIFTREGGKITGVNETPARALAQRFPERLMALCVEFSKHAADEAQPFALAEALATASLPKEVRVKALTEFAQRGSLANKRPVLQVLAELDDKKCAELLVPLFQEMPKDSTNAYWTCPEAAFTHVVMLIDDDDIWRRYVQVAKRSSVGLRMEMMNPLCYRYIGETNRGRRLAFAAAFLDDETLRDLSNDKERFEGPCAAFTIPKITVRDFAAMQIAAILGLHDTPDEFWTSPQWDGLRKRVREKLSTEKLPSFK